MCTSPFLCNCPPGRRLMWAAACAAAVQDRVGPRRRQGGGRGSAGAAHTGRCRRQRAGRAPACLPGTCQLLWRMRPTVCNPTRARGEPHAQRRASPAPPDTGLTSCHGCAVGRIDAWAVCRMSGASPRWAWRWASTASRPSACCLRPMQTWSAPTGRATPRCTMPQASRCRRAPGCAGPAACAGSRIAQRWQGPASAAQVAPCGIRTSLSPTLCLPPSTS